MYLNICAIIINTIFFSNTILGIYYFYVYIYNIYYYPLSIPIWFIFLCIIYKYNKVFSHSTTWKSHRFPPKHLPSGYAFQYLNRYRWFYIVYQYIAIISRILYIKLKRYRYRKLMLLVVDTSNHIIIVGSSVSGRGNAKHTTTAQAAGTGFKIFRFLQKQNTKIPRGAPWTFPRGEARAVG